MDETSVPTHEVGMKVSVRDRFLGQWNRGFEVAEVLHNGYLVRRLSDSYVLPDVFPFEDVDRF